MPQQQAQPAAVEEYGDVPLQHVSSPAPKSSSAGGGGFSLSSAADAGQSEKQDGSGGLAGLAGLAQAPAKEKPKPQKQPDVQPDADEYNHTIYVTENPPAKKQQPETGGLASVLNQREQRAQRDLYSDPEPAPQAADTGILGGMAGIVQSGLRAPSDPVKPLLQSPPASEEDDPETEVIGRNTPAPGTDDEDDPDTALIWQAWLISKRDGSRIDLTKPLIRVGRQRPDIDIDLRHNIHVGHHHAKLIRLSGGYTVIDDNSSNHTYVNHQMVKENTLPANPVLLKNGDLVVFADEAFEYHVEQ